MSRRMRTAHEDRGIPHISCHWAAIPAALSAIGGGSVAAGAATVGTAALGAYSAIKGSKSPGQVQIPAAPPVATVDDAQKNLQQLDRIRRRRGVLANMFGGGGGAGGAPSVATKTLLGQ